MPADWAAGFLVGVLLIWIFIFVFCLKWIRKVALRNKRSAAGFGWLFFFAPLIAWSILLTIDKRE